MFTASTTGLRAAQEHAGHLLVGGGEAGLDVRDRKMITVRVLDGDLRLLAHEGQDLTVGGGLDAAGVHQDGRSVPRHSLSPYSRSRVTPGVSSTMDSRRPTILLNSMDLPTLGRPTIAIKGNAIVVSLSFQHGAPAEVARRLVPTICTGQPRLGAEPLHGVIVQKYVFSVPQHVQRQQHRVPSSGTRRSCADRSCPVSRPATSMVWPKKSFSTGVSPGTPQGEGK